jgi:hypothetical protein
MAIQGQINIVQGTYGPTCTDENDLIRNQALKPEIRKWLEYKNRRYIMTLLTDGAVTPYGINPETSKKPKFVDNVGKGIGNKAYRFDVIGRIETNAVILSQVGASATGGGFQLLMQENYLYEGAIVVFNSRLQARVTDNGNGSTSAGFVYSFQTVDGTTFSFATDVQGQSGTYTCMKMHTSYGEGSLRGYSRDKKPDVFVNHTTIQRATATITGDADSDILWYEYSNAAGMARGWMYTKVQQLKAIMSVDDERHKLFGVSSMKNTDGSLRTTSALGNDPETGYPIVQGDGFEQQVNGNNILYGSGTDGQPTADDFEDIMQTMQLGSNQVDEIEWYGICGTAAYANVQRVAPTISGNQGTQLFQTIVQSEQAGGVKVGTGSNFMRLNLNGNSTTFIKHTLFDDSRMFTALDAQGSPDMSSTIFFIGMAKAGSGDGATMEILHKQANGLSRKMVDADYIGLTGKSGFVQSEQDANKYACLKQDMLVVYNTSLCGIIYTG